MRSTRRFLSGFRLIVDTLVDTPLKRVAICSEKNPNMALMLGRNGKLSVKSYDSVNLGDSSELLNSLESAPESSFLPKSFLSYLQPSDVSKFCEHLNPIIFFNLGINKSTRHIDFYNFCIPDDFLDEESKRRVMRNRSKILGVFPLLGKITVGDFKVGFRLLKMFDLRHNDEAINAIKDYFRIPHTSTTGFMKRIAYAPMYPDGVRNLDEMLRWGLVDSAKDKKEYEKRIFNIPLPHEKEEEEYEAMWTIIGSPNFSKFDSKTRSNIFLNIKKGEWATNLAAINNEYFMDLVSQYSQAIADDLLLPIYAQELYKQCREIASGTKPEDLLKLMSHEFTRYVRANLKVFAEGILFSDLTPKQMLEHAKGFDRKIAQLNEAKPVLVARNIKPKDNTSKYCPQWHKIFPDQEIDGFKFK
ncbi:MAG: hypothetical protein FJX34_04655, partial [Alphaproteobacteria bacterium]|nr:hypothetical protein [Alphaproteobacteria bacterium]